MGLIVTDLRHDFSQTVITRLGRARAAAIEAELIELSTMGMDRLRADGVPQADCELQRSVDLRYVGQSYELNVPIVDQPVTAETLKRMTSRFHQAHKQAYGFSAPEEPVELVNVRLTAVGRMTRPGWAAWSRGNSEAKEQPSPERTTTRDVFFTEEGGFAPCAVYDRYRLAPGTAFAGPAIIEEHDSTTVVLPSSQAKVDELGNIHLTKRRLRRG
jgi:N-methylhydantoinase A